MKKSRGIVLANTLIIVLILMIMAAGFLVLTRGDMILTRKMEENMKYLYLEQAAVEYAMADYYVDKDTTTFIYSHAIETEYSEDHEYKIDLSWTYNESTSRWTVKATGVTEVLKGQ